MVAFCYQWCHTAAMPTISLRLTDEQHEQLRAWAHDGQRSVQKEVIWRVFTQGHWATAVEQAERRATEEARLGTGIEDLVVEYDTTKLVAEVADRHFKPDFKK